ncbi:MAG: putative transcriptional regulator [Thermoplasmata archaeon]|jgi:putative transcriptional regulator|nr:putative transcriptional regulator [Thermoplasmata archaeon]
MRATLLAQVRDVLARAGFFLSAETAMRPLAFDLVARRDGELLIVKVLTNVDGLNEPVAQELRLLAQFLDATPLVVGERSSSRPLEPGAVYARYGVSIVAFETLQDYLEEGVAPLVYAAPGGFYVNLDGTRLRALREARGLSLGDLAQAAGVSRRAIGMYEEGMGAMVDVAMRLEEFLNEPLAIPTNPFEPQPEPQPQAQPPLDFPSGTFEAAVMRALAEMGFRVAQTQKSPFAAIGREADDVVLTGFGDGTPEAAKRAAATANLCEVTETYGVFFVERTTTRTAIEGTPVLSREEIVRVGDAEALLKILAERKGRSR